MDPPPPEPLPAAPASASSSARSGADAPPNGVDHLLPSPTHPPPDHPASHTTAANSNGGTISREVGADGLTSLALATSIDPPMPEVGQHFPDKPSFRSACEAHAGSIGGFHFVSKRDADKQLVLCCHRFKAPVPASLLRANIPEEERVGKRIPGGVGTGCGYNCVLEKRPDPESGRVVWRVSRRVAQHNHALDAPPKGARVTKPRGKKKTASSAKKSSSPVKEVDEDADAEGEDDDDVVAHGEADAEGDSDGEYADVAAHDDGAQPSGLSGPAAPTPASTSDSSARAPPRTNGLPSHALASDHPHAGSPSRGGKPKTPARKKPRSSKAKDPDGSSPHPNSNANRVLLRNNKGRFARKEDAVNDPPSAPSMVFPPPPAATGAGFGGSGYPQPAAPGYPPSPGGYPQSASDGYPQHPPSGYPQPPPGYHQSPPGFAQPPPAYHQQPPGYPQPFAGEYAQPPQGFGQTGHGFIPPAPTFNQAQASAGQGRRTGDDSEPPSEGSGESDAGSDDEYSPRSKKKKAKKRKPKPAAKSAPKRAAPPQSSSPEKEPLDLGDGWETGRPQRNRKAPTRFLDEDHSPERPPRKKKPKNEVARGPDGGAKLPSFAPEPSSSGAGGGWGQWPQQQYASGFGQQQQFGQPPPQAQFSRSVPLHQPHHQQWGINGHAGGYGQPMGHQPPQQQWYPPPGEQVAPGPAQPFRPGGVPGEGDRRTSANLSIAIPSLSHPPLVTPHQPSPSLPSTATQPSHPYNQQPYSATQQYAQQPVADWRNPQQSSMTSPSFANGGQWTPGSSSSAVFASQQQQMPPPPPGSATPSATTFAQAQARGGVASPPPVGIASARPLPESTRSSPSRPPTSGGGQPQPDDEQMAMLQRQRMMAAYHHQQQQQMQQHQRLVSVSGPELAATNLQRQHSGAGGPLPSIYHPQQAMAHPQSQPQQHPHSQSSTPMMHQGGWNVPPPPQQQPSQGGYGMLPPMQPLSQQPAPQTWVNPWSGGPTAPAPPSSASSLQSPHVGQFQFQPPPPTHPPYPPQHQQFPPPPTPAQHFSPHFSRHSSFSAQGATHSAAQSPHEQQGAFPHHPQYAGATGGKTFTPQLPPSSLAPSPRTGGTPFARPDPLPSPAQHRTSASSASQVGMENGGASSAVQSRAPSAQQNGEE